LRYTVNDPDRLAAFPGPSAALTVNLWVSVGPVHPFQATNPSYPPPARLNVDVKVMRCVLTVVEAVLG
jgi:hypothetical protein